MPENANAFVVVSCDIEVPQRVQCGTAEYNKELGKSRAESIAELLMDAGVPKEKLVIRSAGESAASNDHDEWPSDRKVEIALLAE